MGKAGRRGGSRRTNPSDRADLTGDPYAPFLSDTHEASSAQEGDGATVTMSEALVHLDSTDAEQRLQACTFLAGLQVTSRSLSSRLNDSGVLSALVGRCADPNVSVQIGAAGALRNMCSAGEESLARTLVNRKNLFDTIFPILRRTLAGLRALNALEQHAQGDDGVASGVANDEVSVRRRKSFNELIGQHLGVLVALCETLDAVSEQLVVEQSAVPLLAQLLHPTLLSDDALESAARLLFTLTEEDERASQLLASLDDGILCAQLATSADRNTTRAFAVGVAMNIAPFVGDNESNIEWLDGAVTAACALLDSNQVEPLQSMFLDFNEALGAQDDATAPHLRVYGEWMDRTRAQRIALEIISNLCSSANDPSVEGFESDAAQLAPALPHAVEELFNNRNLAQHVARLCALSWDTLAPLLKKQRQEMVEALQWTHIRALQTLTALALVVTDPSLVETIVGMAPDLWGLCVETSTISADVRTGDDERLQSWRFEVLAHSLSSLCLLARRLPLVARQLGDNLDALQKSTEIGRTADSVGKSRLAELLGCVGAAASEANVTHAVGSLLFELMLDDSVDTVVSATDALIDVFGRASATEEPEILGVCAQFNIVGRLEKFVDIYGEMLERNEQRLDQDAQAHANEVGENLVRFIDYLRSELGEEA